MLKKKIPIRGLVFEGGSVKGAAFSGSIMYMHENKLLDKVTHLAGSSAGALAAVLLAVGYNAHELRELMMDTDYEQFKGANWLTERSYTFKLYNLIKTWGIYDTSPLYAWIGEQIAIKTNDPDITFKSLFLKYGKTLVVTGCNLSSRSTVYFSHKSHGDMKIRDAVRISMSVPILFKPVEFEGDQYVDGGLLTNFPIRVFDTSLPYESVLGFNLLSEGEEGDEQIYHGDAKLRTIVDFVVSIALSCHTQIERLHVRASDWKRTIGIHTGNVSPADFSISEETRSWLYSTGYRAAQAYFEGLTLMPALSSIRSV